MEGLHGNLLSTDPKDDEFSITGIRQVKIILDAPYFKTLDGMAMPSFADRSFFQREFMFRTDKQKCKVF
jgi:hypothetical protein